MSTLIPAVNSNSNCKMGISKLLLDIDISNEIGQVWDGREVTERLLEMELRDKDLAKIEHRKPINTGWAQMEWIGFEFEHKMRSISKKIGVDHPGPYYLLDDGRGQGTKRFDAVYGNSVIDFKSMSLDKPFSPEKRRHNIILNDKRGIDNALSEEGDGFEAFLIMLLVGKCEKDVDGSFKIWHDNLKMKFEKNMKYVEKNEKRGSKSRLRKVRFFPESLFLINIERDNNCDTMKQGRNSNDGKRSPKFLLNILDSSLSIDEISLFDVRLR